MTGFSTELHRLAILVSAIAPERAHKNKDERDADERECHSALMLIIQINSWIRRNFWFWPPPAPAPLDEHTSHNYKDPQNQKCRQNYVRNDSEVRIFRSPRELD